MLRLRHPLPCGVHRLHLKVEGRAHVQALSALRWPPAHRHLVGGGSARGRWAASCAAAAARCGCGEGIQRTGGHCALLLLAWRLAVALGKEFPQTMQLDGTAGHLGTLPRGEGDVVRAAGQSRGSLRLRVFGVTCTASARATPTAQPRHSSQRGVAAPVAPGEQQGPAARRGVLARMLRGLGQASSARAGSRRCSATGATPARRCARSTPAAGLQPKSAPAA